MKDRRKTFAVGLIGAPFDTNNRGVSALASSLVRLITECWPGASISFFMGSPERAVKRHDFAGKEVEVTVINYRFSPRAKWGEHVLVLLSLAVLVHLLPSVSLRSKVVQWNARLKNVYDFDFIGAINGGDSFSDIYGLIRFFYESFPMIFAILLKKDLVLLPQTYGPYHRRVSRALAGWIIRRSSAVLARDHESIPLINALIGSTKKKIPVLFCPDVAFTLPSVLPATILTYPSTEVFVEGIWVGVNINGLMFNGGYTGKNMFGLRFEYKAFVNALIKKLLEEDKTIRLLFIPHTYGEKGNVNSDPEASRQVMKTLEEKHKDRVYLLDGEYREFELKGIIKRCEFFIGSRMHACIAAISQGVPTAALAYSKKFHGVFEGIGLERIVVDGRKIDIEEAIHQCLELFRQRTKERMKISKSINSVQKNVKENIRKLMKQEISLLQND